MFLVQQLAEAQGEQLWTTWCRDQVKAYRDSASRLRRNGQTVPEDFFDVAGLSTMERRILMSAANALLAERLGSHVDDDTVIEMAGKVREAIAGKTFEAIDRGRALYQHLQRESV